MKYEALSFVLAGELRQQVVRGLAKPKSPTQLVKALRKEDSSISRTLRELEEQKIVENVFPEKTKGRIYKLTPIGESVLNSL